MQRTNEETILFHVYDEEKGKDDHIGSGSLSVTYLMSLPGYRYSGNLPLTYKNKSAGEIYVDVAFYPNQATAPGYSAPGYSAPRPGYPSPGYPQASHAGHHGAHPPQAYPQPGPVRPGHQQPYPQPGYQQPYPQPGILHLTTRVCGGSMGGHPQYQPRPY